MALVKIKESYEDVFNKLISDNGYIFPEEAAKLMQQSESMTRSQMRKFIDDINKRYKNDMKQWTGAMAEDIETAKEEIWEEAGNYSWGQCIYCLY